MSILARVQRFAATYHEKRERLQKGSVTRKLWNELKPHRGYLRRLGFRVTCQNSDSLNTEVLLFIYKDTDIVVILRGENLPRAQVYSGEIEMGNHASSPQQDTGEPTDYSTAMTYLNTAERALSRDLRLNPNAVGVLKGLNGVAEWFDRASALTNLPEYSSEPI